MGPASHSTTSREEWAAQSGLVGSAGTAHRDAGAALTRCHGTVERPTRMLAPERRTQASDGLITVDLASTIATGPARPCHRERGRQRGGHEPQQDLHPVSVGRHGRSATATRCRTLGHVSTSDPSAAVRLVDLRETPLDINEVVASLDDDASGGLVLFVGRVRDHDGGRGVTGLDYSAHPSALDRLRDVCERVAASYDVHGVAAVHRVGTLAIGDAAVVIATTSAHRGVSFDASRALIDTLKAEVPIWKHQRFDDGGEEWVGTP